MSLRILTCLCLAALASACASTNTVLRAQGADTAADRYHKYALAPVDSFTAFQFDSWTSLSRTEVVIWPRFDEAYLVKVWDTCFDLPFAQRIGISRTGASVTKFDKLVVGRERCPISEIRPIDIKKMKADQRAAAEADKAKASAP